jgi:hypothetical protein
MPIDSIPISVATLPRIVAGPVLRRMTRTEVSVWVATVDPSELTLKIREHVAGGTGESVVSRVPTQVGSNLWMTVLTAAAPDGTFLPGRIYQYELDAAWAQTRPISWGDLSLNNSLRPTFLAPPAQAGDLVVAHTSCRKPHGGGRDGLALLMDELDSRFLPNPLRQPHLLLMSGDQIYADEVGHPLMPRILRVAADLVGIDETDVFGPPPLIGGRGPGTLALGYTGATANHLWTFGEFVAMYLLTWSPVLWAAALPQFPTAPALPLDVDPSLTKDEWDNDRANLQLHRAALGKVRKVLANVPSLMILDDHEITDDWNIDYAWVNSVYGKPAGRRAVTNGLLAYALCQHWGNKPAAFTAAGTAEHGVLAEVQTAAATGNSRADGAAALLGVPTPLPPAPPAQSLRDLAAPGAIRYDLQLGPDDGWPVRILILDERTVREYPDQTGRGARISLAGLAQQLQPPAASVPMTLVVAATPVLGTELIERILQPLLDLLLPGGARFADFESWSAVTANHQDLLSRLAAHHPAVLLSGDVHYGFSSRLTRSEGGRTTRLAQFTSSAAKNLEDKNSAIGMFSELIMRLGLERSRATSGYTRLSQSDKTKLLSPPPTGTVLAWDDAIDVLLGRIARERTSEPTALPVSVTSAYGLSQPGWTYTIDPVDDSMHDYAAPPVDASWDGWQPAKSLKMATALQDADLERISRMFVGLPHIGIVTFTVTGTSVVASQELRCPVGSDEPPAGQPGPRHVLRTKVTLS